MTLNSFHSAGISANNMTLGVPRLIELTLSSSQDINSEGGGPKLTNMMIFLDPNKYFQEKDGTLVPYTQSQDAAIHIRNQVELLYLRDVLIKTEIYYDPDPLNSNIQEDREWLTDIYELPTLRKYAIYNKYINNNSERWLDKWVLRILVDMELIQVRALDMEMIENLILKSLPKISNKNKSENDDQEQQYDYFESFHVTRTLDIEYLEINGKKVGIIRIYAKCKQENEINQIIGDCKNDDEEIIRLVEHLNSRNENSERDNIIKILEDENQINNIFIKKGEKSKVTEEKIKKKERDNQFEKDTHSLAVLKKIDECLVNKIRISGFYGITKVSMQKSKRIPRLNPITNEVEYKEEWILETEGCNLLSVLSLEGVDHKNTYCNNPVLVYKTLGIEAARQCLYKEFQTVLQNFGLYVNYRHLNLIVDKITTDGRLLPLNMHGYRRSLNSPISKLCFEEAYNMACFSAAYSQKDNANTMSSQIAVGNLPKCGTGFMDLILDENMLLNTPKEEEKIIMDSPMTVYNDDDDNNNLESEVYAPTSPNYHPVSVPSSPDFKPKSPLSPRLYPSTPARYSPTSPALYYMPKSPNISNNNNLPKFSPIRNDNNNNNEMKYAPTSPNYFPSLQVQKKRSNRFNDWDPNQDLYKDIFDPYGSNFNTEDIIAKEYISNNNEDEEDENIENINEDTENDGGNIQSDDDNNENEGDLLTKIKKNFNNKKDMKRKSVVEEDSNDEDNFQPTTPYIKPSFIKNTSMNNGFKVMKSFYSSKLVSDVIEQYSPSTNSGMTNDIAYSPTSPAYDYNNNNNNNNNVMYSPTSPYNHNSIEGYSPMYRFNYDNNSNNNNENDDEMVEAYSPTSPEINPRNKKTRK
jgi:hypothetical protein